MLSVQCNQCLKKLQPAQGYRSDSPELNRDNNNKSTTTNIDFFKMADRFCKRARYGRSYVWEFFKKEKDIAQCQKCLKKLKHSGNTTNLKQHLRNVHGIHENQPSTSPPLSEDSPSMCSGDNETESDISEGRSFDNKPVTPTTASSSGTSGVASSQLSINRMFSDIADYSTGGKMQELLMLALICWIIKDGRPAEIVAGEGFKHFMRAACPRFVVPHPTTIKRSIEKMYKNGVEFLKNEFKTVKYFSLTCDGWTDSMNCRSYLGITIHYVKNFEHCSRIIGLTLLEGNHTSEYLCSELERKVEFWGLSKETIVAVLTDNAANAKKSITLMLGKEKHASCFAHSLNLLVKETINDVPEFSIVVDEIKNIVSFFHKSNVAASLLEQEQNAKTGRALKLVQEICTRWNSLYLMIERFLLLKEHITLALLKLDNGPQMLSTHGLRIAEDALSVLKPFLQITADLSSEEVTTISKVIPILGLLSNALERQTPITEAGHALVKHALKNMNNRFKHVEGTLHYSVASLLDPRFKKPTLKVEPVVPLQ